MRYLSGALVAMLLISGGATVALWPAAEATPPQPVARFQLHMEAFQTAWVKVTQNRYPPSGGTMHGDANRYLLRVDATRDLGTFSGGDASRWVYRDGRLTWAYGGVEVTPTEFGPETEDPIADLWEEARDGFPNTTFTWFQNPPGDDGSGRPSSAWRLDLPFPWAENLGVFVALTEQGDPRGFAVYDDVGERWLVRFASLEVRWDVPLKDDTDHRHRTEEDEYGARYPYHELDGTRSPFTLDPVGTGQPSLDSPALWPYTAWTSAAWNAPCVAGVTTTKTVHLAYTWDATTAGSADRALDALISGCRVGMETTMETRFTLSNGASAGFQGQLRLRDQTGALLWSAPVNRSWNAPAGGGKNWTPIQRQWEVPAGVQPATLTLALDGTLTWKCTQAGPAVNQVGISLRDRGTPELHWPGCYPELGILNIP